MQDVKSRSGIIAGGNWIVDYVKIIDLYPEEERLVNISNHQTSNGGAPYNVLKALVQLGANFPLEGIGKIGNDKNGSHLLEDCQKVNIDTSQIHVDKDLNTSFTDVMTVENTGKRTFFHFRGANAFLRENDFDFSKSKAKIFHLGYLLLLDYLDVVQKNGMTGSALVLKKAKSQGFMTSVDVVSEQSNRFNQIIPPSLPYVDVLFMNEFETQMLTHIQISKGREIDYNLAREAAYQIFQFGVLQWIVIHFSTGVIAFHRNGESVYQAGINIPKSLVKGTVGAGDAFAAGVLYGLHENMSMEKCLKIGVCVAASSVLSPTSTEGIMNLMDCEKLINTYGLVSEGTIHENLSNQK